MEQCCLTMMEVSEYIKGEFPHIQVPRSSQFGLGRQWYSFLCAFQNSHSIEQNADNLPSNFIQEALSDSMKQQKGDRLSLFSLSLRLRVFGIHSSLFRTFSNHSSRNGTGFLPGFSVGNRFASDA